MSRSAPLLSPRPAALIVGLHVVQTTLLWRFPQTWARTASTLNVSATTFAAASTIIATTAVLAATRSISLDQLGFSRRKLSEALTVGVAVWLLHQAGAWSVVRVFDPISSAPAGVVTTFSASVLAAYGEELVFRVVAVGGILGGCVGRVSASRAVWIAGAGAVAVFLLAHVPHDLATQDTPLLERYGGLLVFGALLTAVYLRTNNVALTTTLHALLNQPLLLDDPGGVRPLIWAINYAACIVVLVWYRPRGAGTAPE